LDLNLHFTGANGLDATTAAADTDFANTLDMARSILGVAGVRIGNVTWNDLDIGQQVVTLDPQHWESVLANVAAGDQDGVHLVVVDKLDTGFGFGG
jgi:hypothetical protein